MQKFKKWKHPGGKLRELGPEKLTDAELLAILISTGVKEPTTRDVKRIQKIIIFFHLYNFYIFPL